MVDTVIDFCKRADDISHFSKVVMEKYGHPKWDLTLTLNNENGLKSLMVPVVDTSNQVKLIIFAYQDTKDHVIFKFVGRNTPQPGLPLATNSVKTLTKESLVGIFNALDKRVAASKIQPNSSMENIKSNSYISSLCWLITWHYADGSVGVLNSQCSYQIIITPGNAKGGLADGQIGVVEDIQIGDGGGGGDNDYQNIRSTIINSVNTDDNIISREIIESTTRRRVLTYVQKIIEGGFPFGWWRYDSEDKVISIYNEAKKVWEIASIEHLSVRKQGFQINLQTNLIMTKVNTIMAPDKKSASMELNFDVEYNYDGLGVTTFHGIETYLKVLSFNAEL